MNEIEKAQDKYIEEKNIPSRMKAPKNCFYCGCSIYDSVSLKEASTRLITGCPRCHRSFLD